MATADYEDATMTHAANRQAAVGRHSGLQDHTSKHYCCLALAVRSRPEQRVFVAVYMTCCCKSGMHTSLQAQVQLLPTPPMMTMRLPTSVALRVSHDAF